MAMAGRGATNLLFGNYFFMAQMSSILTRQLDEPVEGLNENNKKKMKRMGSCSYDLNGKWEGRNKC